MKLTPDDLADAGRAAFGGMFIAPLADALGIRERNLRYWLAGRSGPRDPGEVAARLVEALRGRRAEIDAMLARLE